MGENYALELRDISKRFGSVQANDHVNLTLRKSEILAILGENGSGKTTLMNMIYGISKSKDILLSSIAGALDEKTKKAYTSEKIGKRKFVNKTEKTNNSVSIVYIGNIVREQKEKEGRKKVSV